MAKSIRLSSNFHSALLMQKLAPPWRANGTTSKTKLHILIGARLMALIYTEMKIKWLSDAKSRPI